MLTNDTSHSSRLHTTLLTIVLMFFAFSQNALSQDAAYTGNPRPFHQGYVNHPVTVEAGIANLENIPVRNIRIHFRIIYIDGDQVVFEHRDTLESLDGNSSVRIKAPERWAPQNEGQYLAQFYFEADNDQEPANNAVNNELRITEWPMPFDLTIEQINFTRPFEQFNSNIGFFTFTYEPSDNVQFVNIMAALPNSSEPPVWIVKNFPISPFQSKQTVSVWADFKPLQIENGTDIHDLMIDYQVTDEIITEGFTMDNDYPLEVEDVEYNVDSDITEVIPSEIPTDIPEIMWDPGEIYWDYRGCEVPNIDLDSSEHNPDDEPGYEGDWNACGPASTANSMQWLEDNNDNIPSSGTTHREKMKEMSGMMERGNEDGVTTNQMLKGKLGYIDKHKLPIKVKFQSYFERADSVESPNDKYGHSAENQSESTGAPPTFEWIKEEMANGEDVEIMFGWYDRSGNRHGGHWVVLTGVSQVGNNTKGLYFKDDLHQDREGGTRQQYVNWVEGDDGWSRLVGLEGPNNYCWVESAISESYDPTVTHDIQDIQINQLNYDSFFDVFTSLKSHFKFDFVPEDYPRYLNVFANDVDGDREWILRNILLPPFEVRSELAVWWDMSVLGYEEGDEIDELEIGFKVDTDYINEETSQTYTVGNWQPIPVNDVEYNKKLNTVEQDDEKLDIDIEVTYLRDFELGEDIKWHYRGCEVPNIDLDSARNNPNTDTSYAGDANACGPAGAANSLHWLETTHPKLSENTTHREKLKELSDMMDREDNGGVFRRNFIEAKLEYIDKYKLPIKVKFRSWKFGTDSIPSPDDKYGHSADNQNDSANSFPSFDWMMNEMRNGEDVELELGYYDSTGSRGGGHWVTITGASDVGTAQGFYFKDDIDQSDSGGTEQEYCNWETYEGMPYLPQLSTKDEVAVVETVVSESYDATVSHDIKDVKIEKINYDIGPSMFEDQPGKGLITFKFIPEEDDLRYVNMKAKTKNDEEFWVCRNVLLPPFQDTSDLSVWFDYGWLEYDRGEIDELSFLDLAYKITEIPLAESELNFKDYREIEVFELNYNKKLNTLDEDITKLDLAEPELKPITPFKEVTWHYRGCEVPNIDLDSSKNNPSTVTGYAGDRNACGPAAAANSLQWLDDEDDNIDDDNSHRDKLKELSKMMKREDNGGVYRKDFIEAKLEYIDKHKLPIKVKFQGWKFGADDVDSPNSKYGHKAHNENDSAKMPPKWDWIISEMKNDEDVELEFGYYDSTGTRRGGHWVTVTGVSDNGNYRGIYIKDDGDQLDSGGTRQQYVNLDTAHGYTYLKQISSSKYTCYVETVVSESYDSTMTFEEPEDPVNIEIVELNLRGRGDFHIDSFFDIYTEITLPDSNGKDKDKFLNMFARSPGSDSFTRLFPLKFPASKKDTNDPVLEERFTFKPIRVEGSTKKNKDEILSSHQLEIAYVLADSLLSDDYEPADWETYTAAGSNTITLPNDALSDESYNLNRVQPRRIRLDASASQFSMRHDKPSLDPDNTQYNPSTVDGYAGDMNAGGPAAAANGMGWLEMTHDAVDTEHSDRIKMYRYSNYAGREDELGVYTNDMIKSLLSFIDNNKVPVGVEFRSFKLGTDNIASPVELYGHEAKNMNDAPDDGPDWNWVKEKLDNGYDLMLEYGIYDSTGQRIAGHWVNVTGYADYETAQAIYFNYDLDQQNESDDRDFVSEWRTDQDHAYLMQFTSDNLVCWVESVIASKYDETVEFEPGDVQELLNSKDKLNLSVYRNPSAVTEEININFILPEAEFVSIDLYDLNGRLIHHIYDGYKNSGEATIKWDGRNSKGARVSNGAYLIIVTANDYQSAVKIIRE